MISRRVMLLSWATRSFLLKHPTSSVLYCRNNHESGARYVKNPNRQYTERNKTQK